MQIGSRWLKYDNEHRTREKHQNADNLSKETEFNDRQEQKEADNPEINDNFLFLNKENYDSLPFTRWLDKSRKQIEDHPEIPAELQEKKNLGRQSGMPMELLLKSRLIRETLKVNGYDLEEVEKGEQWWDKI